MVLTDADVFILSKLGIKAEVGQEVAAWELPGGVTGYTVYDSTWPASIAGVAVLRDNGEIKND